jgi:alkylation response protein AidB-like acyl-CoA dehydrogenase
MYFGLTAEQQAMQESVRRFFETHSTLADARRLMDTGAGYDEGVWRQMAEQLGLQSLAIPVEYGGAGFSFFELAIVLEETGRALLGGPFFASAVLAAMVIQYSGDTSAMAQYLPGIASGTTIAALAITEDDGSWELASVQARAEKDGGGYRISGVKSFVVDGALADLIIVAAKVDHGLGLFAVEAGADGLSRTSLPTLDGTRKMARLILDSTPARLVGAAGDAEPGLRQTLQAAAVALSAEQVGGTARCLDMAVEYAKLRVQFGRPIGGFQAVKYICADMYTLTESARSAVLYAAWCVANRTAEVPISSSLTKAYCSDAFYRVAADNIQVHGGIGFTWDHDCHLFFKRATSTAQFLGSSDYHRELVAQELAL